MTRLVILDRDGVINQDSDAYIKSLDEWQPYPSAIQAIARLTQAGWAVAIATNQSGIGRGYYDVATLERIHRRLLSLVKAAGGEIATIAYCPHLPEDGCECRKPKPGLLYRIQRGLSLDTLADSWMVGDSLRDIQAGLAAGCRTALTRTGKGRRYEAEVRSMSPVTWICEDLMDFAEQLVNEPDLP